MFEDVHHNKRTSKRHHRTRRNYRSLPERGWIQFLVLRLLHEKQMHGYQLMNEMEKRGYVASGRFETGSIYTILKRMAKRGFFTSEKVETDSGRVRRVYKLTPKGEKALRRGLESIIKRRKITENFANYYREHFESAGQEGVEVKDKDKVGEKRPEEEG